MTLRYLDSLEINVGYKKLQTNDDEESLQLFRDDRRPLVLRTRR